MYEYEELLEEAVESINKEIHSYTNYRKSKEFIVYTYENYKVIYCKKHKKDTNGCWLQLDELYVYKNNEVVTTHKPCLCPYISFDKNILTMSSDGEIWVYNLDNNKEYLHKHGIATVEQKTETEDGITYIVKDNERIPLKSNRIIIRGEACPWGCESQEIYYTLKLDKDLNLIDYEELWVDDCDIDEEEYNEKY